MARVVSRRDFIKIAAGASAATGAGSAVRRISREPFVRPPEEELPGRASWYASTCRQCPAGCGIIVRVINGRARKIEGNPAHPLNRGKLCARGQAGLQVLYNPDRLKNAVRQSGGRGSRQFETLQWPEVLEQIAAAIEGLEDRSRVAFLGGLLPDHLLALVTRFMQALGAPAAILYDLHSALEGRLQAIELANRWFGSSQLPVYDLSNADAIFSFGANLLETWMSPVSQAAAYGTFRQGGARGRGVLLQFEPRLSATGACADEWIPLKPGTEGMVALGIGRIIVEQGLGRVGSHREHAHLYRDVSVEEVSRISGIAIEKLDRLAKIFSQADRSIAIPGGYLSGLSHSAEALDAVMALNVIMRRVGLEGGVFLPSRLQAPFSTPVHPAPFAEVRELVDRMRAGQVEVLFIGGANPVYELPAWVGFKKALSKVPLVVSFSPFVDETAVQSDLILPDHTYLEGWGYQIISPGADRPVIGGQQPVVQTLYDTRATADVFLALALRIGGAVAEALAWPDEVTFLEEMAAELLGSSIGAIEARTPAGLWSKWRQSGGWWSKKPIRQEPDLRPIPETPLKVAQAAFAGQVEEYPYHLLPYESTLLSDGRGANLPWLQETPDPMTTVCWSTWVELNPETAAKLNVADNDLVRVISPQGQITAPVVVYPAIRPDVVAIPLGQGHGDYGRFAADRGVNAVDILSPIDPSGDEEFAWASTRVRLERVDGTYLLARLESLEGEGRENVR